MRTSRTIEKSLIIDVNVILTRTMATLAVTIIGWKVHLPVVATLPLLADLEVLELPVHAVFSRDSELAIERYRVDGYVCAGRQAVIVEASSDLSRLVNENLDPLRLRVLRPHCTCILPVLVRTRRYIGQTNLIAQLTLTRDTVRLINGEEIDILRVEYEFNPATVLNLRLLRGDLVW